MENVGKRKRGDTVNQERRVRCDVREMDPAVKHTLDTLGNSFDTLSLTRPVHALELFERLSNKKLTVEHIRSQVRACMESGKPASQVRGVCTHLAKLHKAVVDGREIKPSNHVFRATPFQ